MAVFLAAGSPRLFWLMYLILEPRRSRNGATTSSVLSVLPSSTSSICQSSNVCEKTLSRAVGKYLAALNAGIITSTVAIVSIFPHRAGLLQGDVRCVCSSATLKQQWAKDVTQLRPRLYNFSHVLFCSPTRNDSGCWFLMEIQKLNAQGLGI